MLEALKFVRGAVAKKDLVPVMQHFLIRDGRIKAFNGAMGLCSPIPVALDVAPKADQFIKAIEACAGTVALHQEKNGKLVVQSGDFQTYVDTVDAGTFPTLAPGGKVVKLDNSLLPALRYLEPFIAEDASRPWACGVLFNGESAFATNNIVLLEFWLGFAVPFKINVPVQAVRELLRINEDPVTLQLLENRVTFGFSDGRWLTTQLYETPWPDVDPILNRESNQLPFTPGLFEALEKLAPFTDDLNRVYFFGSHVATSADPELVGAGVALDGLPAAGCFNLTQLLNLRPIAATIDFGAYPNPSVFYGERSRGIIVGLRS